MEKEKLHILLEKYLKGRCSPQEEQELMNWYASFEQQEDFTDTLSEKSRQQLGQSMRQAITRNIERTRPIAQKGIVWPSQWALTAIAASVLLIIGWFVYLDLKPEVTYQTAYGEVKTITLPDQSVVTLNGHSVLRMKEAWSRWEDREVWLEGEAFFSVTHKAHNQRFVVHTSDQLSVEVLGTEFNVAQRATGTSVALASGKVELHIGAPLGQETEATEVPMVPGEVVILKPDQPGYEKKQVENIDAYYAWKAQKLWLDRTSLEELMSRLQETHGLKLRVKEEDLLHRKASGTLPLSSSNKQLISNLAALYELEAESEGEYTILRASEECRITT